MARNLSNAGQSGGSWRKIGFRLAAICLGLAFLLFMEIVCTLLGWGGPAADQDPFVGFSSLSPLFVPEEATHRYVVSAARLEHGYFQPESFPIHKTAPEFRIFCLGGSTVQGRPYSIETSFTSWLRLNLRAADPSRSWDVINGGGVSYASYRIAPILQEVLAYQPDLLVLYCGHNEFLEDRTYEQIRRRPFYVARAHQILSHCRAYNVLREACSRSAASDNRRAARLPREVDAMLDYQDGLNDYERDDDWRAAVIDHYEFNLRRMIALAHQAEVPLVLLNPASNLRTPPFKSQHASGLDAQQIAAFHRLWDQALQVQAADASAALMLLDQALEIDPRYAAAHFHRGQCLEQLQRWSEARASYLAAQEEDICPLRMLQPMHERLRRVAVETHTPLLDVQAMFRLASSHDLPAENLFVDHVHPTFRGHQMIAEAICRHMIDSGMAQRGADYESNKQRLYVEQFASLPLSYFERGKERLQGLMLWTKGRAKKTRAKDSALLTEAPQE